MTTAEKLVRVAGTDRTFVRNGRNWVGKCLICNGPIAFDAVTGEGATLEHIRARSRGGTETLENLGIVHGRCNWEKGRRWDPRKRRSDADYDEFVARLLQKRADRWRPSSTASDAPASRGESEEDGSIKPSSRGRSRGRRVR